MPAATAGAAARDSQKALILTEFEGLTQARAAAHLGLSTSGMKSRVQRARAQLKELLIACCQVDLDRRGDITSYTPRSGACDRPERATRASEAVILAAACVLSTVLSSL